MELLAAVVLAVVITGIALFFTWRERRWLRRVEQARGDPERLAQLLYGPRSRRR